MKYASIDEIIIKTIDKCASAVDKAYSYAYSKHPIITNYVSSAIGTVGGDIIAKQFTQNPQVKPRDILFTGTAAIAYSYLAPKMIEWSTKVVDKISDYWKLLKDNKKMHTITNSVILTAMYFPVNMSYWAYLSTKNHAPVTIENMKLGAITLAVATIPYLIADYFAIKKFSTPETKKYLRPFYSGVELLWNTLFAGGNYIAKKL